jgi:hypothetical protein
MDQGQVMLRPEQGDTDADLDRVLCPAITDRKIAGRAQINITDCLPQATVQAMSMGPLNCKQFVEYALGGEPPPPGSVDSDALLTEALWEELLNRGYRLASFAVLEPNGKVAMAIPPSPLSWKQLNPAMGDVVFMRGGIALREGKTEPDPEGDDFTVRWDHVGFFLVRSRRGLDYHLAKDGESNPIGVYHTGMALQPEEGQDPGAYVKGVELLMAYLRPPTGQIHGEVKIKEGRDLGDLPPGP